MANLYIIFILFRYGANKLLKGPKVQLDRSVVENYFKEEDSEEEREKAFKLAERKSKRAEYYKRLKRKNVASPLKNQRTRSPKKPGKFQCDLCPKAPYTTLGALNLHKRRQHDMTASKELQFTKFQCDMCNNPPFLTNIALMNHKSKVHVGRTLDSGASSSSTAVPRFQCNLCNKPPFFTSVALLNHKTKAHWPTRGNPITNGFKRDLPKNPLLDGKWEIYVLCVCGFYSVCVYFQTRKIL